MQHTNECIDLPFHLELILRTTLFSHTMRPDQSPAPNLHLPQPTSPTPVSTPPPSLFRKQWASNRQQPNKRNKTKHSKTRQKLSHKAGPGNPIRGKESQEHKKEPETTLFPQVGFPQKHNANSCNIYSEDLVQTQGGCVLAT